MLRLKCWSVVYGMAYSYSDGILNVISALNSLTHGDAALPAGFPIIIIDVVTDSNYANTDSTASIQY